MLYFLSGLPSASGRFPVCSATAPGLIFMCGSYYKSTPVTNSSFPCSRRPTSHFPWRCRSWAARRPHSLGRSPEHTLLLCPLPGALRRRLPAGFSPLRLFGWLLSDLLCIYEPPFLLFRFMTLAELDKLCEQRASSVQRSLLLTVGGLLPAC